MNTNNFIWIPDKEFEWILAEIIQDLGDNVVANPSIASKSAALISADRINLSDTNVSGTFRRYELCEFDPSHLENLDDLCLMNNLHEGPLIHILRRRWLQDRIYTYAGDVLISVNPYKMIHGLYDNPLAYFSSPEDIHPLDEDISGSYEKMLDPHAYYIANSALRKLMSNSYEVKARKLDSIRDQSVIISGESGSGDHL